MKRLILPFIILFLFSKTIFACDSCGCTMARVSSERKLSEKSKMIFFDTIVEQQVWHKRDPQLAHELHHQGHDSHDKTSEEFYHFALGASPWERITLLAEIPYVVRHALEVDNHAYVGGRQRSEGFGDLSLNAILKALKSKDNFLGPVAGIKLPTGRTTERNKQNEKFEPEMQPGSGSFDSIMGAAYQYRLGRTEFHGNSLFTLRTKGSQEFRYGNLFSSYLYADYLLNPESEYFKTKVGVDSALQIENHQRSKGTEIVDSGGTTWLLGPEISTQGNRYISIFGNFLFPVYQNLGGVHQLVQFIWNAGVKISF